MKVSEIFFSIQGEGINIGKPAVFLRLQGCNLRCSWCDTKYTWGNDYKKLALNEVKEQIKKFDCDRLVITGGEPLLQDVEVKRLIDLLPGYKIEIETNGTIYPQWANYGILFNVSPKPPSSENNPSIAYNKDVLKSFNKINSVFKFVVQNKDDFKWMKKVIKECGLNKEKVIVMPEGKTSQEIVRSALAVIEEIKKEKFRIIPRLQVLLWGVRRGI